MREPPWSYVPIEILPHGIDEDAYTEGLEIKVADGLFHIGSCDQVCQTLICTLCGGREFHVGKASYFTGIKCSKCGWEKCIHAG